ncbi:TetR/AcrR family transcriptional regulator [Neomoorella thermoacetica]|uniref:TetR/AcrR family transcriptional regulator n=1 Tax=Neomoorella thermoacetica TaxID=1525 RepID=UPI0008FB5BC4|nr:TetR/AcrR family transcriptional regulator [Moorella thermoacetica]OIQ62510.1 fatty acid metabolism regulator protein [Moorella thermoacetica]
MSREAGDKRRQILAAAVSVFADRGFHQARIADIAAAAGVGKGTIYEYFSSKKELFQQLLVHIFHTYLEHLRRVCREEASLEGFLRRLIGESLEHFQAHREITRILLSEHPPVDAATQQIFFRMEQEKLQHLQNHLQAALERGEMRPVPVDLAAIMITGFITALGYQLFFYKNQEMNLAALSTGVTDLILRGIRDSGG